VQQRENCDQQQLRADHAPPRHRELRVQHGAQRPESGEGNGRRDQKRAEPEYLPGEFGEPVNRRSGRQSADERQRQQKADDRDKQRQHLLKARVLQVKVQPRPERQLLGGRRGLLFSH